jgi:hypothetical protein
VAAGTGRSVTQQVQGSAAAGAPGSRASGSAAWMPFPAPHPAASDAQSTGAAAAGAKGSTAHLRGSIFKVGNGAKYTCPWILCSVHLPAANKYMASAQARWEVPRADKRYGPLLYTVHADACKSFPCMGLHPQRPTLLTAQWSRARHKHQGCMVVP